MADKDSVLAQQFDDSKWENKTDNNVKEWTSDEVRTWVESIDSNSESIFTKEKITGRELLTLGKDELYKMGIERPATVSLLFNEITKLKEKSADTSTLIEHSAYCFGKIIDYLRWKELRSLGLISEEPVVPTVSEEHKSRFERVVNYYFPGDSAKLFVPDAAAWPRRLLGSRVWQGMHNKAALENTFGAWHKLHRRWIL